MLEARIKTNYLRQELLHKVYRYLYRQLEYTNRAIAPTLTAFRYRSIKSEFLSFYQESDILEEKKEMQASPKEEISKVQEVVILSGRKEPFDQEKIVETQLNMSYQESSQE